MPFISLNFLSKGSTITFSVSLEVAPGKGTITAPPLIAICGSSSLGITCKAIKPRSKRAIPNIGVSGFFKKPAANLPAQSVGLYFIIKLLLNY